MTVEISLTGPLLSLVFLIGSATLSGLYSALQKLGQLETEAYLTKENKNSIFRCILRLISKEKQWQNLLFSINFTKGILQLCYSIAIFFFFIYREPFSKAIKLEHPDHIQWNIFWILMTALTSVAVYLICDFLLTLFSLSKPKQFLTFFFPIASPFILICSPLAIIFLQTFKFIIPSDEKINTPTFRMRDKIQEFLRETQLSRYLDSNEQDLILSVASFKERIAREVMVPRIDVFSLPSDTSIEEATSSFLEQGYSRIPVYKDNVDHIIGVLLYKDILNVYANKNRDITLSIERLVKPIFYTPETKKISHLLQEFKNRQIHLAIVVDEYGGTEGIVTIEDILEELVGEIADEYDISPSLLYSPLPTGGWIVDAKMGIFDIEEELGVKIPQGPEYDTIGGYIFHRAGAIPTKGWRIHHNEFDLEVVSSTERSLDKIKITPHEAEG